MDIESIFGGVVASAIFAGICWALQRSGKVFKVLFKVLQVLCVLFILLFAFALWAYISDSEYAKTIKCNKPKIDIFGFVIMDKTKQCEAFAKENSTKTKKK